MAITKDQSEAAGPRFGTFGGVFTPCTLTILGVIMFLRLGQVVGRAGVLQALAIILVANVITLLTALSLSAIATNTRVRGGGAYYLISRSLGVEFGGAIGVVFFLAQAIAVALYVGRLRRGVCGHVSGRRRFPFARVATIVNVGVFALRARRRRLDDQGPVRDPRRPGRRPGVVLRRGDLGHRARRRLQENLAPEYAGGEGFFTVFALFFPAVTGIMAGANMSGDLKDPGRIDPPGHAGGHRRDGGRLL